ncbi:MAG: hypothetical protein ACFFCW_40090 [Candidatus Hodarchaeota archaeon]
MKIRHHDIVEIDLGPLASTVMNRARWRGQDEFPSSQLLANEIERVLSFAEVQGQFGLYLGDLTASATQRDSAIAELRVAFYFHRNQFSIAEWRPIGLSSKEGEFLVRGPSGMDTFIEVKSPGWEGELEEEERKAGRTKQPKYINAEVRSTAPWERIQFAVNKAYKKFSPDIPNLLVIVDDLFWPLRYRPEMHIGQSLYSTYHGGSFTNSVYANLSGVGIFWVEDNSKEIWYEMMLFLNPYAHNPLPCDMQEAFRGQALPIV